jgi:Tol biopolymer transport system component
MPDVRPNVREVFEMVTKQVEPDLEEWREQERRQRRRNGVRKAGAMALVAAVAVALIVGLLRFGGRSEQPAVPSPTPSTVTSPAGSLSVAAIDLDTGDVNPSVIRDVAPYRVDVSPGGSRIAFVQSEGGHPQIFFADLDGSNPHQVTGLPDQPGCDCGAVDPAWSPDGDRIAFSGLDLRGNKDIYVVDVASGAVRRLTRDFSGEAAPDWSPDGRTIAFESGDIRSGDSTTTTGSIWTIDLASGHRTRVVAKTEAASPTWSPDGSQIAFSAASGPDAGNLWVVRPDGSGLRQVLAAPGAQTAPAWSPAGGGEGSIAFASDQAIAVLDVASGGVRAMGAGALGADPAWSTDGSTIYVWRASST